MSGPPTPPRPASERGADLRVARLHLRGGAYALARAELEALAGRDELDRDGILDLAEVRWRTGDLAGAGVAAAAWLEDGEAEGAAGAVAHVISAEAAAARGSLDAAATHVEAAAAEMGDRASLDAILAGIGARAAWPWERDVVAAPRSAAGPVASRPAPSAAVPASRPAPSAAAPVPGPAPALAVTSGAPMSPPAAELVAAGASLLDGAPERAAILLALALRADRAAAEAVLAALDESGPLAAHAAALAFVRAEALRAAGRHDDARIAYASAERLALAPPAEAGTPRSPQ